VKLGLFLGEKTILPYLPSVKNCFPGIFFFPFPLEISPFQVSNILVRRGAYRYFDEFIRVAPKQKFGFFKLLQRIFII
jgi:hypothetical protein